MKSLIASFMFLAAPAFALQIMPSGVCNGSCVCSGVETDNPDITLNLTSTSITFPDGSLFQGSSTYPAQWFSQDGRMLSVTLQFQRWTTRTTSGRLAGHTVQRCAVVSGSVM